HLTEAGKTQALGFTVSGDIFGEIDDVSQIRVIKIFPDGTGRPFRVVTKAEDTEDKTVALYDADDNIVTGAIEPETMYTLAVFIKDGGEYDLDGEEDGTVIDPIAIIRQAKPPVPKPAPHGGGSGGCTAGAGTLALLTLIPLWMRRGKR
ncbi:Synerg-CTERM sorting domain-containing protein, partial [Cloacibacillus sp.]|uniref:Synerg-CTERM sorting domain-containing protein n=1 Tax=Cloacibacillus sp. TaxID=2049023 RepID=UPI0025C3CBEE